MTRKEPMKYQSKGVSLRLDQWELLKQVKRVREDKGEANYMVSSIIQDLIDKATPDLEKELKSKK